MADPSDDQPYVPASRSLPEITATTLILGLVLSVILAGANAYLGLFAGMTVSATIPAAVISMAIFRLLKGGNILANTAVMTAASAGEALAAGAIFTLPALVMAKTWANFDYWQTTIITGLGGLLGVLFTIPLRRALIVEQPLQFPEGCATAEVLKIGESGGAGVGKLIGAAAIGAAFKIGATGLKLFPENALAARNVNGAVGYIGSNLSPALIAVGYIVGINVAIVIFVGGALNALVAIPIFGLVEGVPTGTALEQAETIWGTTRFIGVGAMIVGGLWALVSLRTSLARGIRAGMEAYKKARQPGAAAVMRTERDAPMQWVVIAAALSVIPLFFVFHNITGDFLLSAFMAVVMLVAGFLFSAVAAYMAGLVGSSNNPISGVTVSTVLTTSLLILLFLGSGNQTGAAAAILIGAVVASVAAVGGDNMQDLKTGYLVGATPYKQQIMLALGVLVAAFVLAPVLNLLHDAYGIGIPTHPGQTPLRAPQATLMMSVSRVAQGIESADLPWAMIGIGMGLAVVVIVLDLWLEKRKSEFRTPVLALAVGIYLPFELAVPIFLGGLIAWAAGRVYRGATAPARKSDEQSGMLFSAGLITGESLAGIALAIPIAASSDPNVLTIVVPTLDGVQVIGPTVAWPGLLLLGLVMYATYRVAVGRSRVDRA